MKIYIKINIEDAADAKIFRSYAGPVGKRHWDAELVFGKTDQKWDSLIITDNTETFDKIEEVPVVYIGKAEDVEDRFDRVYDVWPRVESEKARRMRFERLIANLRSANNSWLYRQMLRVVVDADPSLISIKDVDDHYVIVNRSMEEASGKTREQIRERGTGFVWNVQGAEENGEYMISEQDLKSINENVIVFFEELKNTTRGVSHFATRKAPIFDPSGEAIGIVTVSEDKTHDGMRSSEVSDFLENLPFPILICDPNFTAVKMNYSFRNQVSGSASFDYLEWKKNLKKSGEAKINKERHSVSQEFYTDYFGKPRFFFVSEHEIRDSFGNKTGYFVILRDTTFERTLEQSVLGAANSDGLTGLYNRRYLVDHINNHREKPLTLLYMDLDNFKNINDTFSRSRGDEVLIKTASFIKECFPRGTVARLGGDEFAVVLEGYPDKAAIEAGCILLESKLQSIFRLGGLFATISISVTESDGSIDAEELLLQGGKSMFRVKSNKRG
ncbi:diguanylate cyclase (GGDEF) domain-containing protein [Ruminococcaceae bacterium KH2T8]|nr:diguanylate cyclase (GGDEF) domain-containing protein [Ruminococcaceae bacterium KH2T8]